MTEAEDDHPAGDGAGTGLEGTGLEGTGLEGTGLEGTGPEGSLAELEREKRFVETLYRVAQTVAQKDDLREIVQAVTDETTAITGAGFGAFFYNVVGRDGERYSLFTISGAPREKFESFPMPRATEIFRPTFEGTGSVRLDDVLADSRFGRNPPYHGMPPGHLPVRSYLAVPVFAPDESVVGGLFFGHEEVAVFTAEHEQIATGIATQAGIAIEKARLLFAEREARAEAEARADAARALELVEDGVIMIDSGGFVRLWNRAAGTITGLPPEAVLGRAIGDALPGWEPIALSVPVGGPTEAVAPRTLPLDTLEGRELWISVYGVAYGDGTVYAFRDVSDQRALESVRADMIATVSHELRTPVAAVYGAAETLRRRQLGPEVEAQLLEIVHSESQRLTLLVDDILLTSRIDSGRIEAAREDVDPLEAVAAVIRTASLGDDDPAIVVEALDTIPTVVADEEMLRQVLANLIENALKYGSAEGAPVTVRVAGQLNTVRFEIVDTGPGIPSHERAHVFEKFYRLDPHLRQGVRGTGLGLYICRELVHRMQGSIGVEAAPSGGAAFWFELPRSWRQPVSEGPVSEGMAQQGSEA